MDSINSNLGIKVKFASNGEIGLRFTRELYREGGPSYEIGM